MRPDAAWASRPMEKSARDIILLWNTGVQTMADTFFFLKLDGIEGESQTFDGQIDVLSFSEGVSNAGSCDAGTGGNTGQSSFAEVTISKNTEAKTLTSRARP